MKSKRYKQWTRAPGINTLASSLDLATIFDLHIDSTNTTIIIHMNV